VRPRTELETSRRPLLDFLVGALRFASDADEDAVVNETVGDRGCSGGAGKQLAPVLEQQV
jgi:hypothetical protein